MTRVIIGLVGPLSSGKGVVSDFLIENGFDHHSLSDIVRDEANLRGIPVTRENLQNIGNDLRTKFGGHVLAQRTLEKIKPEKKFIVIDSIRNPEEIYFLKSVFDILIIGIDAPQELRLIWYLERAKIRKEDSLSELDFYCADGRDSGVGETVAGQQVRQCLLNSDIVIENRGSKKELIDTLQKVIVEKCGTTLEGIHRPCEKK